jgi:hypothetical protein
MQSRNQKERAGEELSCPKGDCPDEKSKAMMRLKCYRCLSLAIQAGVYLMPAVILS